MAIAKATHKNKLEIVANPRKEKNITPKQEEFCKIYVCEDVSQTEAAIRAGFSKKSAHAIASQLLDAKRYPHVVERIRDLKLELAKKYEVTVEGHVKKLSEIRDTALQSGAFSAAVAAEKCRGQAAGIYIDRKEILQGRIDQKSKEEVMKEILKIQNEYPALAAIVDDNITIDAEGTEGKSQDKKR